METCLMEDVIRVINESVNNPNKPNITEDTNLFDDLYLDSISIIQLIVRLENDLNISIESEYLTMENLSTPRTIYKILTISQRESRT